MLTFSRKLNCDGTIVRLSEHHEMDFKSRSAFHQSERSQNEYLKIANFQRYTEHREPRNLGQSRVGIGIEYS